MNKWRLLASKVYRFFYPIDLVTMYRRMGVKIGEKCHFQFDVIIDHSHYWLIEIGNNVTLAPRVHILSHDASTKLFLNYTRIGKVTIGNNVFIGANSIILPGVHIADNVIVGAGSVVSKSIPENSVYAGNPAKFICSLDDFLTKHKNQMGHCPVYDESFTLRQQVSEEQKVQMLTELTESRNTGYIV
jgi:maltose O-acetyltransferase